MGESLAEKIARLIRENYPRSPLPWDDGELEKLLTDYKSMVIAGSQTMTAFVKERAEQLKRNPHSIRTELQKEFGDEGKRKPKPGKAKEYKEPEIAQVTVDFSANPEAQEILRLLEKGERNLFITGQAGTGKSTLLNAFRLNTKRQVVVLAPTGVAAVNVGGQTIHSFCNFPKDVKPSDVKKVGPNSERGRLLAHIDTVVIDEVSMVRADLFDMFEKFLRINGKDPQLPFGGYHVVLMGDLYQLPPVDKDFNKESGLFDQYESPYFFDASAFKKGDFAVRELKTTYRQKDPGFLEVLGAVRTNRVRDEHLEVLNARVLQDRSSLTKGDSSVYLTTTNARATEINSYFLQRLPGEAFEYRGRATGNFRHVQPPAEEVLQFKVGSQIMLLTNDRAGRWVNGTMGTVERVSKAGDALMPDTVVVKLENGRTEYVQPHTWEMTNFVWGKDDVGVRSESVGSYTQYPMRLAWALTVHKSQGKTFDRVNLDLSQGTFAHGQLYVALSRCRTLEGVYLSHPVHRRHVILDKRVLEFFERSGGGDGELVYEEEE